MAGLATQPLWELCRVSKGFPGVQALEDLSLALYAGEIHGLVGENGSGKSTLVKCLSGVHQPDSGELRLRGRPVLLPNPTAARLRGVATIYQEFSLVPTLSVAENIHLGRMPTRGRSRVLDWEAMRRNTQNVFERLAIPISPDAIVNSLSVAEQQLVEIAKAVSTDASLVIMDEPTTALGLEETERLHELMRRLADHGQAILYISHRLDDVLEVADRVTILKDGCLVATRPAAELDLPAVVRLMVGSDLQEHYPKLHNRTATPLLEVRDLRAATGVNGVSFTVHRGEVFGLAGMMGSGRTQIARALFGADSTTGGFVFLNGRQVRFGSPQSAIRSGVALVTENRKSQGLFPNFEGPRNISIASLRALLRRAVLDLRREGVMTRAFMTRLRIHPGAEFKSVQFLSGGNQQKVIIARWLMSEAKLFILDEPTQGIDIAAKIEVYRVINEITAQGNAVILISSDFPELLAMSDTIGVVRRGRIVLVTEASQLDRLSLIRAASDNRMSTEAGGSAYAG